MDDTTPPSTNVHANVEEIKSTETTQDDEKISPITLSWQMQNELTSASRTDNEIILDTIHELINDIIESVISQLAQNSSETNLDVPGSDSDFNKSLTPTVTVKFLIYMLESFYI